MLVAAAGYGKSSALEADRPADGVLVRAAELVGRPLPHPPWLAVDDLDDLPPADQQQLLQQLAALPADVHVVVASRSPLDPGWMRGQVQQRGPMHLALDAYATARVLAEEYGVLDPAVAATVHRLTQGWPALVHFAGETLADHHDADLADALSRPGSTTARWLQSAVLAPLTDSARTILGLVADLGPITPGVCELLAHCTRLDDVDTTVHQLLGLGLLAGHRRLASARLLTPVPVVAAVVQRGDERALSSPELQMAAARCYEAEGLPYQAAQACARAGNAPALEALLAKHGQQMLWQGYAAEVVELFRLAPGLARSPTAQRTLGEACRMAGDAAAALRTFEPLIERANREGWDAGLASRVAMVHYGRGDSEQALAALDAALGTADPAAVATDQDSIDWLACRVHVLVTRGQLQQARAVAVDAVAAAERNGCPRALAAAHTAMARASVGSRKDAHHELALRAAAQAGDVLIAVHALVNQSCRQLSAARYAEACSVSREAVRLAELGSPPDGMPSPCTTLARHSFGLATTRRPCGSCSEPSRSSVGWGQAAARWA